MTLRIAQSGWKPTQSRSLAPLRFVVRTAITPPRVIVVSGSQFARTARQALSRPAGPRRLGDCVGCGRAVTSEDPFLRYRGDYYHAHNCLEFDPPALRRWSSPLSG